MARRVSRREAPAAALVLARAFSGDPLLTALLGRRRGTDAALTRYFELEIRLALAAGGEVLLDDEGLAAAVWRRPGGWPDPLPTRLRTLPSYLRVFSHRAVGASRGLNVLAQAHPGEPHWYLAFVGVAPGAERGTRGDELLAETLDRCDAERTGAYAEATSADGARLFARLGFKPRRDVFPLPGVAVRTMWRAPRRPPVR